MNLLALTGLPVAIDAALAVQLQGPLATATDVAQLIIAAAVVAIALVILLLANKARKAIDEMRGAVHQNVGPVSDRARAISDNVEFITRALRTDVERLNASVKALSDRLHQASDRMEERIEEFNALMEVVQGEAEGLFIDTASTVRGVREGARAIGRPRDRDGSEYDAFDDEDPEGDGFVDDEATEDAAAKPTAPATPES